MSYLLINNEQISFMTDVITQTSETKKNLEIEKN